MEIILMVVGAIISAGVSWVIAYKFHKKAGEELQGQIDSITELNESLAASVEKLVEISYFTAEKAEMIEKHAVSGTIDDPNYPYKN